LSTCVQRHSVFLSADEIINILLFGAPTSWQRKMDCQGFDPLAKTVTEAAEFVERIKMLEDFDGDRKVAAVRRKATTKRKPMAKEAQESMAPSIACCTATTTFMTLQSARHSWRKLRS